MKFIVTGDRPAFGIDVNEFFKDAMGVDGIFVQFSHVVTAALGDGIASQGAVDGIKDAYERTGCINVVVTKVEEDENVDLGIVLDDRQTEDMQ